MHLLIGVGNLMIGFFLAFMTKDVFELTWGRLMYAPEKAPKWFVIVCRACGAVLLLSGADHIVFQFIM